MKKNNKTKKHYIRKYSILWWTQKIIQFVIVFAIMCLLGSADSITDIIVNKLFNL